MLQKEKKFHQNPNLNPENGSYSFGSFTLNFQARTVWSEYRSLVFSFLGIQVIHNINRLCCKYEAVFNALTLGNLILNPRRGKTRKGRAKSNHKEISKFNAVDAFLLIYTNPLIQADYWVSMTFKYGYMNQSVYSIYLISDIVGQKL